MTVRLRHSAALAAAALCLAACSGGGDGAEPVATTTASADASPTVGTLVSKDAFALTLPDGWTESDPGDAMLLGLSDETIGDFTTNLNVVEDTTLADLTPDELGDALQQIALATEAGDVEALDPYEVDGETAARITQVQDVGSIRARSELIAVAHADTGYLITLSFSPTTTQAGRNKTVDSVMDTWTWAE